MPEELVFDYTKLISFPIDLVHNLIKELITDCTFSLDINYLPDDKEYLNDKNRIIDLMKTEILPEDMTGLLKFNRKYAYKNGVAWKYELLECVLDAYHEPILNLHFLGPYLKDNNASLCSYELIF